MEVLGRFMGRFKERCFPFLPFLLFLRSFLICWSFPLEILWICRMERKGGVENRAFFIWKFQKGTKGVIRERKKEVQVSRGIGLKGFLELDLWKNGGEWIRSLPRFYFFLSLKLGGCPLRLQCNRWRLFFLLLLRNLEIGKTRRVTTLGIICIFSKLFWDSFG